MIVKAGLEDMEDIYNLMCILENKELDKEHFVQTYQQNQNVEANVLDNSYYRK